MWLAPHQERLPGSRSVTLTAPLSAGSEVHVDDDPQATEPGPRPGRARMIVVAVIGVLIGVLAGIGVALLFLDDDGEVVEGADVVDPTVTTTSTTTTSTTTTISPTTSPEGQVPAGSMRYLSEFDPVDVGRNVSSFETGQGSLSGTVYPRSLMIDPSVPGEVGFVEYDLGRNFSRLGGLAGLRDDVPSDMAMHLEIFGDGERLLDETSVTIGNAIPIDLDITNVLRLRIQATVLDEPFVGYVEGHAIFADLNIEP